MDKQRVISDSELMLADDGSVFHLRMRPEDIEGDTVIMVGDPARVALVGRQLSHVRQIAQNREFHSITGEYRGHRICVLSHGIGCGCIDIVMNELDALVNVHLPSRTPRTEARRSLRLVRIGTAGTVQNEIQAGEAIVTARAIGVDALGWYYTDACATFDSACTEAFTRHLNWPGELPRPYVTSSSRHLLERLKGLGHTGMTLSAPGFFAPQGRCVRLTPRLDDLVERASAFEYEGQRILNMEMESGALSALATMLGHEAITVTLAIDNRSKDTTLVDYHARMDWLAGQVLNAITA